MSKVVLAYFAGRPPPDSVLTLTRFSRFATLHPCIDPSARKKGQPMFGEESSGHCIPLSLSQHGNADNISASESKTAGAWSGHTRVAQWLNPPRQTFLQVLGGVLVVAWCAWMGVSFLRHDLNAHRLWIQSDFGVDFFHHIDRPARILWSGNDPYADRVFLCVYPPLVARMFVWVNCMTPRKALAIWLGIMTVILVAGAWAASKTRHRLQLSAIPPSLAAAALLFSTAALFAVDRGQCDPLSVAFILLGLPMLQHRSKTVQFLAGAVLCLAPWTKVYPGLLIVALVGLRYWRALAGFIAVGGGIAVLDFEAIRRWLAVNKEHMALAESLARFHYPGGGPCPWNHSLSLSISNLLYHTPLDPLAATLGKVGAAALLLPLLAWVTWRIFRCNRPAAVAYPYMLWVVALATFMPPVCNDYNFCVMPLVVLAVWDRRDPLLVHVAIALLLLWWQPVDLGIGGRTMLVLKFLGLAAAGVSLAERAAEQSQVLSAKKTATPSTRPAAASARPRMAA
jgi:hypothetical protein